MKIQVVEPDGKDDGMYIVLEDVGVESGGSHNLHIDPDRRVDQIVVEDNPPLVRIYLAAVKVNFGLGMPRVRPSKKEETDE